MAVFSVVTVSVGRVGFDTVAVASECMHERTKKKKKKRPVLCYEIPFIQESCSDYSGNNCENDDKKSIMAEAAEHKRIW